MTEIQPRDLNRVPVSYWYRLRRAIENTRTAFVVLVDRPQAKSTASLWLELGPAEAIWSGESPFPLLRGFRFAISRRKPGPPRSLTIEARALE